MEKSNDFISVSAYKKMVRKVNQNVWENQKEKVEVAEEIAEISERIDRLDAKLDAILKTLEIMHRKTNEEFKETQNQIVRNATDVKKEVRNRSSESKQTLDSNVELLKLLLANQLLDDIQQ